MEYEADRREGIRGDVAHGLQGARPRIAVGLATCGRAVGGQAVFNELERCLAEGAVEAELAAVGCRGLCYAEPLVEVVLPDGESRLLGWADADCARSIVACISSADPLAALDELAGHVLPQDALAAQERRVLANCGVIDPLSLDESLACGGYTALRAALADMSPADVIAAVSEAGLRGRGGAGFPTGEKWAVCADNDSAERYFIVNGDEGDPGAYMDRALLESDPHRVLEGLVIACYATGVHQAYFFIRAEYSLATATVKEAIEAARRVGFVGKDILGSGFDLEVSVVRGAGAFLCGEGTAMVNVLENKKCLPRKKPPHLAESGLWGKPTCINNVETLANVPLIIGQGAEWFRSVGTEQSPGTKIFSVVGAVEHGGLVEISMGSTLRKIVEDVAAARTPKAVQIGGPSGAILPTSLVNLEISFEGLVEAGGMMGSGGIVVISETQCVVDTSYYLLSFSSKQSCKRCRACRDGSAECVEILKRITCGEGCLDDIEKLQEWAELGRTHALCGLGRTAFNPVTSGLRYFMDEYLAHIEGRCPSLVCQELISYEIDQSKCQGERCCLLTCPGNAIKGRYGKPGNILARLCQKCGMCITTCPYSAVRKVSPPVS